MMYDVAAAIAKGQREYQEDAVAIDFPEEDGIGFVVLADGMGGHEAGDVASRLVVTEVSDRLKDRLDEEDIAEDAVAGLLREATLAANACIADHVSRNREVAGMGTTLVVPMVTGDKLHWLSVGDSPLYLYDEGELRQVNEDHSMAPQIDMMLRTGLLDEQTARNHPERNCLTSVLMGTEIPRMDWGKPPVTLRPGNIVIVSSDGLQFLEHDQICRIVSEHREASSAELADALMAAVDELDDPDQDNISFAIIKIGRAE